MLANSIMSAAQKLGGFAADAPRYGVEPASAYYALHDNNGATGVDSLVVDNNQVTGDVKLQSAGLTIAISEPTEGLNGTINLEIGPANAPVTIFDTLPDPTFNSTVYVQMPVVGTNFDQRTQIFPLWMGAQYITQPNKLYRVSYPSYIWITGAAGITTAPANTLVRAFTGIYVGDLSGAQNGLNPNSPDMYCTGSTYIRPIPIANTVAPPGPELSRYNTASFMNTCVVKGNGKPIKVWCQVDGGGAQTPIPQGNTDIAGIQFGLSSYLLFVGTPSPNTHSGSAIVIEELFGGNYSPTNAPGMPMTGTPAPTSTAITVIFDTAGVTANPPPSFGVYYGTDSTGALNNRFQPATQVGTTSSYQATVTGLTPSTQYYFQASADNGLYSEKISTVSNAIATTA